MVKYFFILAMFLLLLWAGHSWAYTDEDCIACHGGSSIKSKDASGGKADFLINMDQFSASVHSSEIGCNECHSGIIDDSHQNTMGSGAVNCNECHDQENRHGVGSVENHPKCFSCHTKHNIRPKDLPGSSIYPDQLENTCRGCHPYESGKTDYLTWFTTLQVSSHKKQDFGQSYSKGNCLGCHQGMASHGLIETVSSQNCQVCHQSKKGVSILVGKIHPKATSTMQSGIFTAAIIYQFALFFLIYGGIVMFVSKLSDSKKRRD
ncbi:MAG: hypothetical protein HOD37_20705 [Bacteroidetes bacterium]|jgi:hypothetical protein|nr:hypothetical protein [Bacteroidota bacterium]